MPSRNREHLLPKLPVDPLRIRNMPRQFGAIDRNLVYGGHLVQMSTAEIALYTFLICVSDPQGLSYYSDRRLSHDLHLRAEELLRAREALITRRFILYRTPIYQLLDLPAERQGPPAVCAEPSGSPRRPVCSADRSAVPACARPHADRPAQTDGVAERRTGRQGAVPIGAVIRSLLGEQP